MDERTCLRCDVSKPVTDFYVVTAKGRRRRICIPCINQQNRDRRTARRERSGSTKRVRRKYRPEGSSSVNARIELSELIRTSIGCTDCGIAAPAIVLQFDHLPRFQKSFGISEGVRLVSIVSDQRLVEEMLKCDVVCANCHVIRTAERARAGESVLPALDWDDFLWGKSKDLDSAVASTVQPEQQHRHGIPVHWTDGSPIF